MATNHFGLGPVFPFSAPKIGLLPPSAPRLSLSHQPRADREPIARASKASVAPGHRRCAPSCLSPSSLPRSKPWPCQMSRIRTTRQKVSAAPTPRYNGEKKKQAKGGRLEHRCVFRVVEKGRQKGNPAIWEGGSPYFG